ncbi:ankyrin repeat domain-containing protein [Stutzerimonas nitrititolerans]|uniref:ankyrin repeat domain-containing protein n=1 Tax=Stutzerimonas nitrititolerans TaxID=2482751 RepID=UPI00289B6CEC|nr:ankyrin repeat domain-containing protein [Stutzerimonas nitrititolerans]
MKGLLLITALLFGSGAVLANDGPLTSVADTPEAVRTQLRDYFLNAARFGDNEMLDEFIQAGFDLNTADHNGYTALILAAYNGQGETVERLLSAGADACARDRRGNTALLGAIFKGELRIAQRLLATECDPDQRNEAGQTPAMYAALFQREALLEALRERGADLTATDSLGNSVESLARGEIRTAPAAQ